MSEGYFVLLPRRIIPPKRESGDSHQGIAGDSHLVKTAPEVNFFYEKYK